MTIFQKIDGAMDNIIDKVAPELMTQYMTELQPLASTALAIYLIWLIIPLLIGNSQYTAAEVMKKAIVWMIVWSFAFNIGGVLTQANKAAEEIYKWASGSTEIYAALDGSYDDVVKVSKKLFSKDNADYIKLEGFLAEVLVLGSYYTFAFVAILMLIVSKMILKMLVLALPLTILAILFPMIKSMFANWLHLFIDVILTVLFLNILFKLINKELSDFIKAAALLSASPAPGNLVTLGAEVAFTIMLMLAFVIMSKIMASKLASAAMSSEAMASLPRLRK